MTATAAALVGGFVATLVLTVILSLGRGFKASRMNLPLMIGMAFSANRDQARWIGLIVHFFNGWIFALLYMNAMETLGMVNVWVGGTLGLLHALFVLTVLMSVLPAVHPRMASEDRSPNPAHQLEPPGFFAVNYGRRTPVVMILAHVFYGAVLGLAFA